MEMIEMETHIIEIIEDEKILTEGIYEFREGDDDGAIISSIADYIESLNTCLDDDEKENMFIHFEPDFLMTEAEIEQFEKLETKYYLFLLFSEQDYVIAEKKILKEVEQAKQVDSFLKNTVLKALKKEAESLIDEGRAESIEILSVDFYLSHITMDSKPEFSVITHSVIKVNEEIEVFEYPLNSQMNSIDCLQSPILENLISWEQYEMACNFASYVDEIAGGDSNE